MSVIVSEEQFINSFNDQQKHKLCDYNKVMELSKSITNKFEIARLTSVPKTTVGNWISGNSKPCIVTQIEYLKSINLLPLVELNNEKFMFFLELFAFLFGDGHLHKNIQTSNYCGEISDLKQIQLKLKNLFNLKSRIYSGESIGKVMKIKNGVKQTKDVVGYSNLLWLSSSAVNRLFFIAGAPAGDKVESEFILPEWLINSSLETKRCFLGVLFGNELQCPYLRTKGAFSSPQLGFHKVEDKFSILSQFLNQIKGMLLEFGIKTSKIKFEDSKNLRLKDNKYSRKQYFFIYSNPINILKLFNKIPFIFAMAKQQHFEKAIKQFLKVNLCLKFDWGVYENAVELHKCGLGHVKIFKKLKLKKSYLYKLNYWLYCNKTPKYFDSRQEMMICWSLIK